jgi:hypothetical protein
MDPSGAAMTDREAVVGESLRDGFPKAAPSGTSTLRRPVEPGYSKAASAVACTVAILGAGRGCFVCRANNRHYHPARMSEHQRGSVWPTLAIVTLMTAVSVVLLLSLTSPEFSFDEADLLESAAHDWGFLWSQASYGRHFHGPMGIYLAKLGEEAVPAVLGSLEVRTRLPIVLVASFAIGFLYWALRNIFRTSQAAALVGSSLLLLSVIRLQETNVIGPHHLMLVCTLMLLSFGYHWRNEPTKRTALALGCILAFGALTMTYVIPAALCAAAALTLAGSRWIAWRPNIRVSRWVLAVLGTAAVAYAILWPPGIFQQRLAKDFGTFLLTISHHPTLVGDHIFEVTPRWAMFYWLVQLDAPILMVSAGVILTAFWRTFRARSFSSRHIYIGVCLAFYLGTAVTAHLAGARNLLQLLAVLCLATGALFDEALGERPFLVRLGAPAIVILALVNLVRLSRSPTYTPFLATDGYRAFVEEGKSRMREKATAVVYGVPVLTFYARKAGVVPAWNALEIPWTTQADVPLAADAKYVLIPAFIYEHMPADHPTRRIVLDQWKVVWSFKRPHVWELRLFERPERGP